MTLRVWCNTRRREPRIPCVSDVFAVLSFALFGVFLVFFVFFVCFMFSPIISHYFVLLCIVLRRVTMFSVMLQIFSSFALL